MAKASPNPRTRQLIWKGLRREMTPDVGVEIDGCSERARSILAASPSDTAAGRSFFNSVSSSEKSFMGNQIFFQGRKRVAITRRGRVLRNFQNGTDLSERKFVPNFHDNDLTLFAGQTRHRFGERLLGFVIDIKSWSIRLLGLKARSRFTSSASRVPPEQIEGNGADGREKESAVFGRMLFPPETNKCFLDNVLGVRRGADPLPGEKHQAGGVLAKTGFPIFMSDDILHDL